MTAYYCTCGRSTNVTGCWQCCQRPKDKAIPDQIERLRDAADFIAGAVGEEHARWVHEAANEIGRLSVLLAEAKAVNEELRTYWKASEAKLTAQTIQVNRLRSVLESLTRDPPATLDEPDTDAEVIQKMRTIARDALSRT
jgi:hypothetical protein